MIAALFLAQLLSLAPCSVSHCTLSNLSALDRAHDICESHGIGIVSSVGDVPNSFAYVPPWKNDCDRVEALWQKTEAAAQDRQRRVQEETDKKFVHDVATGKLK